jgi:NADPH:quinone reductase-like Zn-dependent oxidoreductase
MNETVKAIRFYKTGRSDVLSVDRIQLSQLKENEVLVRVLAVAVSRLDLLWRQGASIDSLLDWMNMRPRIATWRQMIRLVRLRKK